MRTSSHEPIDFWHVAVAITQAWFGAFFGLLIGGAAVSLPALITLCSPASALLVSGAIVLTAGFFMGVIGTVSQRNRYFCLGMAGSFLGIAALALWAGAQSWGDTNCHSTSLF